MNDSSRRPRRPYPGLVASTEVRRSLLIGPLVPPRLPSLRCAVWWLGRYCRRPKSGSPPTKNASGGRGARSHRPQRRSALPHSCEVTSRTAACPMRLSLRPPTLDAVDDVLRHRDVIELL